MSLLSLNGVRSRAVARSWHILPTITAGRILATRHIHANVQPKTANNGEDVETEEYVSSYNYAEDEELYGSTNLSELTTKRTGMDSEGAFFEPENAEVNHQKLDRMADMFVSISNEADKPMPTQNESYRLSRKFIPGSTYAPKDLDEDTYRLYRERAKHIRRQDPFNLLGLNPLLEYKNVALLSRFVTEMGRIRPRTETGLSGVNQRRLSKAIKRSRAMGLMPFTYRPSFAFMQENRGPENTPITSRD
ncbi:hypothetical protein BDF19DRAFT_447897 [Syncephalis fuscata]|nr:hypothetical protein BDF19DRAFT_447897 [Syncephalis fuscata]